MSTQEVNAIKHRTRMVSVRCPIQVWQRVLKQIEKKGRGSISDYWLDAVEAKLSRDEVGK